MVAFKDRSPLSEYLLLLKIKGVDMEKLHWKPVGHIDYEKELKKVLKEEGVLIPGYEIRRVCRIPGCLNPLHYRVIPKMDSLPNLLEVKELVELIDLEVCENLGFERYLALFNEDNPLPATREDMRAAVTIALSRAKKTVPMDDLFWKGIEK